MITRVQKLSQFLYIYIQVRKAIIFHSIEISNKNTNSKAAMAQSVEHSTAARKVPGLSLGQSILSLVKI